MKPTIGLIGILIVANGAFAQTVSNEAIRNIGEVLSDPTPRADCGPEVYCRDLSEAVCNVPKSATPLMNNAYTRFPEPETSSDAATMERIRNIENDAFSTLPVTRENLVGLFEETKSSLERIIQAQQQLSQETRAHMTSQLSTSSFMMGSQYLEERIASLSRNNPDAPREDIVRSALDEFESFCADGGLQVNAFRRGSRLVFCPGLLYAVADAGANDWQKMANALSFTMAHEVGHTISSTAYPGTYRNMGACYNRISDQRQFWRTRGEETAADFWGTQVFSERLRSQGITNGGALEAIRQATVDFCFMNEDETYPSGRARINLTLSRNPVMRTALGCDDPTLAAPMCSLQGEFPSR